MNIRKFWIKNKKKDLLLNSSDAEKTVFKFLSASGYRVIRQYPIQTGRNIFFADLYIPNLRLIIELDGGYHFSDTQKKKDRNRSYCIWRLGYHIVRIKNKDAFNTRLIKLKILSIIKKRTAQ